MITKMKKVYPFLLLVLVISCRPDRQTANWDVGALAPVLNSRIDINDLVEDSLLTADANNQLSLVYNRRIAEFKFDRIGEGFSKAFENTVKLQSIDLGTRVVQNTISLGQLASNAGIAGGIIILNNGNTAAIPPFTGIGPETFTLDATDFFQSMTLTDGWLVIEIHNGLPIELTNVQYYMQNSSAGSPAIISKTVPSILPGADYADSVQLNNNVTIEGQLDAVLQNMDTPGSNGNNVLIDTSDALLITVTIKDLVPSSATAIFPDQVLIQDTADTEIEDFDGDLTSMHVGTGKMFLDATSTIEDEIIFDYIIPSASNGSGILQFTEHVPPAPVGGFSTQYAETDIAGYDVDLTGRPGSTGIFNTFFTITDGRIDSSGNLINLSLTDSVFLRTGITDLLASRGYGFLGLDTLEARESSELDIFNNLQVDQIDFDEVRLSLNVNNYMGAPITTSIKSIQGQRNSNTTQSLVWNMLNQDIVVPAATENTPGTRPTPGTVQLDFDKANSNIDEVLETQPDTIVTELDAFLNKGFSSPDYNQFVYLDYGLEAFISAEIPLYFSAQNMLFKDTSAFDYNELDPGNRLQSGSLILIGDNYFPFDIQTDLILLGADSVALDTLLATDLIQAGTINANGTVVQKVKSEAHYPLNAEIIENLKNTSFMVIKASFSTASLPEKVRFYTDSHLDFIISADLNLRTGQ